MSAASFKANFIGRRILLIMPKFFGYDEEIIARLSSRGAEITAYQDRPSNSVWMKSLIRVHRGLASIPAKKHVRRIIAENNGRVFDDILVIKGESLSKILLQEIFDAFPQARKTFYLWDSFRNSKGAEENFSIFDRAFSFDYFDVEKTPGLKLRPLFFLPRYALDVPNLLDIDVVFVGTVHTDRYRVLKKIESKLPRSAKVVYFLYFPAGYIYIFRRIFDPQFWKSRRSEFNFKPLLHEENSDLHKRARAVVDIERVIQSGLTMRTFEVLAAKKKLITTNKNILNSDLYDARNICVIDRGDPVVPTDFIGADFVEISSDVLERYSLDGWLDEVLG